MPIDKPIMLKIALEEELEKVEMSDSTLEGLRKRLKDISDSGKEDASAGS